MNDNMNKININNSQENNIKKKDTILPILLFHLQNIDEKDKKK